jgi:lipid II:glycine glycyltransferase (peptidoglycan interpeptide bridge formation enzyme)
MKRDLVERLPSKHKALSSNPRTAKNKTKQNNNNQKKNRGEERWEYLSQRELPTLKYKYIISYSGKDKLLRHIKCPKFLQWNFLKLNIAVLNFKV